MSDNSHSLSVTLKAGTDFSSPWIVVYGDDPDEVEGKLNSLGSLITATVEAANLLKAANNAAPLLTGGADAPAAPAAAPARQTGGWSNQPMNSGPTPAQPAGDVLLHPTDKCQACGQSPQFKTITSKKNGRTYEMWSCPSQRSRGDGHYSEFAN